MQQAQQAQSNIQPRQRCERKRGYVFDIIETTDQEWKIFRWDSTYEYCTTLVQQCPFYQYLSGMVELSWYVSSDCTL